MSVMEGKVEITINNAEKAIEEITVRLNYNKVLNY